MCACGKVWGSLIPTCKDPQAGVFQDLHRACGFQLLVFTRCWQHFKPEWYLENTWRSMYAHGMGLNGME